MNERIRELLKQARLDVILNEHAHEYGNGYMENTPYPEIEKFAELIVQECDRVIKDSASAMERGKMRANIAHAGTLIKQHFGVE
jgi:hypothetical protein